MEKMTDLLQTFSIAGMLSGCTEGIIVCPFELVKIRQQAERNVKFSEVYLKI